MSRFSLIFLLSVVVIVIGLGIVVPVHGEVIDLDSDLYRPLEDIAYEWELLQRDTFRYYTKLKLLRKEVSKYEEEGLQAERYIWPIYSVDEKLYHCSIPFVPPPQEVIEEDKVEENASIEVPPYLESLKETCLYRLEGWWTYEFCYGKHVRQFHQEKDGTIVAQFNLGLYSDTTTGNMEDDFYSEEFTKGTVCDLTAKHRTCEIRYYCNSETEVSILSSIKEPSSCNYQVKIETPLLCKHPLYSDPEEDETEKIFCFETPVPVNEDIEKEESELVLKKQQEKTIITTGSVNTKEIPKENPKQPKSTTTNKGKNENVVKTPTTNQKNQQKEDKHPSTVNKVKTKDETSLDPIDPLKEMGLDDMESIEIININFVDGLASVDISSILDQAVDENGEKVKKINVKKVLKQVLGGLPVDLKEIEYSEEEGEEEQKKEKIEF